MRIDAAYFDIMTAVMNNARVESSVWWYGFGSYFRGHEAFSDIDLLAVCSTAEDAGVLRSRMRELCERWPVHLVIMTEHEAAETDFILSEGCIPLAPSIAGVG
jgi:predicted nucleotidyltransferase